VGFLGMDIGGCHQALLVVPSPTAAREFQKEGPALADDAHLVHYDVYVFTLLVEELAVKQRFVLQGRLPAKAQYAPESFHHGYLLPGCVSPAAVAAGLDAAVCLGRADRGADTGAHSESFDWLNNELAGNGHDN
jgi:hypothetical protein